MELDAQRSIATGDMTHRAGWKESPVPIRLPTSRRGRLHDEHWIASREEGHDRLTPAAVMWKLDDIGMGHRTSVCTTGDEASRGDGFDVAGEEKRTGPMRRNSVDGRIRVVGLPGGRGSLRGAQAQHDGCVVVARRPESEWRPEHFAGCIAEHDSIAHRDRLDARPVTPCRVQQFRYGA